MAKGYPRGLAHASSNDIPMRRKRVFFDTVVTVNAAGAAVAWGTVNLGSMPEGYLKMVGAVIRTGFDGTDQADLIAAWNGDFSVGSNPTADNDLTDAGEADIIPSTATTVAAAKVSPEKVTPNITDVLIDNTANDKEFNLNVLVDAASITDDGDADIKIQGVLEFNYIKLLDD